MKQNIFKKLMLIALLLTSNAVWAYDFEAGGIFYNITSGENKTVEVTYKDTNYNSYSGEVVIPATVTLGENLYTVTSIGQKAFIDCNNLTSIEIPETITFIGPSTFINCSSLTSFTIPSNIKYLDKHIFYGCNSLNTLIISDSQTGLWFGGFLTQEDNPENLGATLLNNGWYFYYGDGTELFVGCPLETIYIGRPINSYSYEYDDNGDGYSAIFAPVTTIKNITFSDKLTTISNDLFKHCIALTSINIPSSVTLIGSSAFYGCTGLASITIPKGVTSIGASAFYGCEKLKSIELPSTITSIDSRAFSSESFITRTIKCNAKTPPTLDYGVFNNNYLTLEVPFESVFAYQAIEGWSKNSYGSITYKSKEVDGIYYLPTSETEVAVAANPSKYTGDIAISAEIIVDSIKYNVTSIGERAFEYCTTLTNVGIPEGITCIGKSAFYGCTGLTYIELPSTITNIRSYAFYSDVNNIITRTIKCNAKTPPTLDNYFEFFCNNITLEVPFESILAYKAVKAWTDSKFIYASHNSNGVFYMPTSETEVEVVSNPSKYIGDVVIPTEIIVDSITYSVTSIGERAFHECRGLEKITIPEGVTTINNDAFYDCKNLTYIELPNSTSNIGDNAFFSNGGMMYRTIKCNAKIPPTLGIDAFNQNKLTLEVPFESILVYQAIEGWSKNSYGSITYKSKEVDGIYYLPTSKTEVEVAANPSKYTGEVVIPAEIKVGDKTFKVTSIGDNAFYSCDSLTNVTIPEGVTSIGDYVFSYCKKLTNVKIPNTVTRIGNYAFLCCRGLTSMTISEGITFIGEHTFEYCSSLTSITIPNGITFIGNGTFRYCSSLKSVIIPNSVTNIGNNAFSDSGLISVTIPNSVTLIEEDAFFNCIDLTSVVLSNNITNIGKGAFSWCSLSNIECKATIPPVCGINVFYNSTTALLKVPFESVLAYKSADVWKNFIYYAGSEVDGIYYLPTSKTEVAVTYKDKNYNSYTSDVVIPDTIMVDSIKYNVTSIGERAFYNCNKLNGKVSLPSSITSIGEYAFSGTKYSICEISATTPPTISSSSLSAETSLVLVPKGTPNAYKEADVWKNYTIIAEGSCDIVVTNAKGGELARSILTQTRKNLQNITGLKVKGTLNSIDLELINTNMSSLLHLDITETDVTEIPAEAFKNVVTLMSVKLPSTLQTIGDYAFSGCKVLSGELILPEKLTKIGNYAFQNCSGLSGTLKIPANVTYINSYAFSGCYNIKNIDMTGATKLYEIGNNAFRGCTTIESVDMAGASRLINLGTYVFSGCTGLKSVDMTGAKSLTSLSSYIFNGCNSLETVLFPETLETIGSYSFYNCAKLDNLKLPTALKSINSSAFNYCTGLKSIDMTEAKSMTSLTSYLFSNLYSLETVLFPETLETIGNNSFYNCTKLNNIKLPAALKSIDSSAFYGCTGMTTIDFSACTSLSTIYSSAFYGCVGLTMLDLLACESLITIKDSAFSGCSALATINFPISLVSIGSNAFANCTNLLQLSVPCTIPPVIENHAEPFAGVDNIACILSIPSDNFFDYYSANYWGGFVDVEGKSEVQNGVNDATDEEDGEGEGDSAGEGDETGKHKKHKGCKVRFKKHHKGGHSPRLMALKGVNTLAETEDVSNTSDLGFTGDGQSLFVGFGESVTYYLTPEEGKEIESVYFNDEDVTSQLVNNTLTVTVTSDMTMTSFVVNMKNASPKLAGDINGDGEVNVTDVVKLYSYILGNSTDINESVVDLNGDGEVNVSDIVKLYSIILSSN